MKYEEEIPTIKGFSNTSNNQSKQMTRIYYLNEG